MRLTKEQTKRAKKDVVKDYASHLFINAGMELEEIQTIVKIKLHTDIPIQTISRWSMEDNWKIKRADVIEKEARKQEKINIREMKEELDERDYNKIVHLIEALEEKYYKSPAPATLTALVGAYKYLRELRTLVTIGEHHSDISVIMANFNQTVINQQAKEAKEAKETVLEANCGSSST